MTDEWKALHAESGEKRKSPERNPFPNHLHFRAPLALFDLGLVPSLSAVGLKRYLTLVRLANFSYGTRQLHIDFGQLSQLDGISPRHARRINHELQEFGLIQVLRTRPLTYLLLSPDSWKVRSRWAARIVQRQPFLTKMVQLQKVAEVQGPDCKGKEGYTLKEREESGALVWNE